MTNADTSSPTVSLKVMIIPCTIDAREGRHLVVTDLLGTFLHADMEVDIHMMLEGTISELIVKLDPSLYRKYIWKSKRGRPMILSNKERHYMGHFKWPYYSVPYYMTP